MLLGGEKMGCKENFKRNETIYRVRKKCKAKRS